MKLVSKTIKTPVGELALVANETCLVSILFQNGKRPAKRKILERATKGASAVLAETEKQLAEYFAGRRKSFDLPLDASGTDFQKSVWRELRAIPFGKTRSYGEIAARVGSPKAFRAVGGANGNNPIAIVVPCHRVIGASGALTGFEGGEDAKAFLLALEK